MDFIKSVIKNKTKTKEFHKIDFIMNPLPLLLLTVKRHGKDLGGNIPGVLHDMDAPWFQ